MMSFLKNFVTALMVIPCLLLYWGERATFSVDSLGLDGCYSCLLKGLNTLGDLMPPSSSSCIFPRCSVNLAACHFGFQGVVEVEKGPSQVMLFFLKLLIEQHLWNVAIQHPHNMKCILELSLDVQVSQHWVGHTSAGFQDLIPCPTTWWHILRSVSSGEIVLAAGCNEDRVSKLHSRRARHSKLLPCRQQSLSAALSNSSPQALHLSSKGWAWIIFKMWLGTHITTCIAHSKVLR